MTKLTHAHTFTSLLIITSFGHYLNSSTILDVCNWCLLLPTVCVITFFQYCFSTDLKTSLLTCFCLETDLHYHLFCSKLHWTLCEATFFVPRSTALLAFPLKTWTIKLNCFLHFLVNFLLVTQTDACDKIVT